MVVGYVRSTVKVCINGMSYSSMLVILILKYCDMVDTDVFLAFFKCQTQMYDCLGKK